MCEKDSKERLSVYDVYGRIECSEFKKYLSTYKLIDKLKAENDLLKSSNEQYRSSKD